MLEIDIPKCVAAGPGDRSSGSGEAGQVGQSAVGLLSPTPFPVAERASSWSGRQRLVDTLAGAFGFLASLALYLRLDERALKVWLAPVRSRPSLIGPSDRPVTSALAAQLGSQTEPS